MKNIGLLILVVGIGLTIFTSFKFFTREKVIDLGAIQISKDKPHYLSWSPILGIVLIGVGGVVLWQNSKK